MRIMFWEEKVERKLLGDLSWPKTQYVPVIKRVIWDMTVCYCFFTRREDYSKWGWNILQLEFCQKDLSASTDGPQLQCAFPILLRKI